MAPEIVGTLPVNHFVDQNGSLSINVPFQVPHAKVMPQISLAYHSASNSPSTVGLGWVIKGASIIERVPATIDQDGRRGVVNYDENDCFALDGQRLIQVGHSPTETEYRFELERWSKIVAYGNQANPTSWEERLPNGTIRKFGDTTDSNIKAQGITTATRVWAISKHEDAFTNYISFMYNNDTVNGSFYLTNLLYGGNDRLKMAHQRAVSLAYESRSDKRTTYIGGHKICIDKRLAFIESRVYDKVIHKHTLVYRTNSVTQASRLKTITLVDASGATLRPLSFDWLDGPEKVFHPVPGTAVIKTGGSSIDLLPIDVTASGKSDMVIISRRYDHERKMENALHLAVHLADGQGKIHEDPSPGSGFPGLRYPDQLLPLDINADGKTDLLHIVQVEQRYYNLSLLMSTGLDGRYETGKFLKFDPEIFGGTFYSGDFTGDGRVGLIYVYENAGRSTLRFVQFTSDGVQFIPLAACDGPKGFSLHLTRVVVGDLNGKGAEDVFFIKPKPSGAGNVCDIHLVDSVDGTLRYNAEEQPLKSSGESVPWLPSTTFHPYAADGDGKTSILVTSRSDIGTLQWQLLRSTGPSFLPQPVKPTITDIPYEDREVNMGSVTLAKVISTFSVELVTTYRVGEGSFKAHVLRFDGEKFTPIADVQDSSVTATGLRWADLRGLGRTDYTLYTIDEISSTVKINFMSSSVSSQPVDFISGYENGLGAKNNVSYASITDSMIYSTDDKSKVTTAAVNAMAHNVSSSINLGSSRKASYAAQRPSHSRAQVVHFPIFVVSEILSATQPGVVEPERQTYKYKDAKLNFDGRGWLGFKSITKSLQPVGTCEATTYSQTFPFLGQITHAMTTEIGGHKLLEKDCDWYTVSPNPDHPEIQSARLRCLKESHYEAGDSSFDVTVSYQHDNYANITQVSIKSTQPGVPMLTIDSEFADPSGSWIVGNKTREWVTQKSAEITTRLKDIKYVYLPGTSINSETSSWVADSVWVNQKLEFDSAGNETVVKGPGPARRELAYDETYSHIVSTLSFTDDNNSLEETAIYDLALGKPVVVIDANGHTVSRSYDMIGRILEISEGENISALVPIEKHSFHHEGDQFYQIRKVSARRSTKDDQWSTTKSYIDGAERAWKIETSRPDDVTAMISTEVRYDGAGRIVACSRDHLAGSSPMFNEYKYNARSQVIEQISPPVASGVSPIIITYDYKFESGRGKVTEVRSEFGSTAQHVVTRELIYLPNSQPSAADDLKFVKPFVTRLTTELGQVIETQFDGLGRLVSVKDPSGVELCLAWDGLSRQVERRLSQPGSPSTGKGLEVISHFFIEYNDNLCENAVINKLTDSTVVTKMDYLQRPISKTTADQMTMFTYDTGGVHSKGRIVDVVSTTGNQENYRQHFDYDIKGNLTRGGLSLDGHNYTTSHEWTPAGGLSKTINPDGSISTRTFLADGETVHKIELFGAESASSASVTFGGYDNAYLRPLVADYGNGIKSTSSIASSGVLSSTSLSHENEEIYRQGWTIDAFTRIGKYEVSHTGVDLTSSSFHYDTAGQLVNQSSDFSSNSARTTSEKSFAYDDCGNLSTKDGKIFTNVGWQLKTIKDQRDVTECTFEYSKDGNLTSKVVHGKESAMKYDAEGRLVDLDGTTFVYDYGGRMIKSALPNGDVTIYPSDIYEVSISASGKKSHTAYLYHGYRRASHTHTEESMSEPASSDVYYFHSDHLGSTIAASDKTGKIVTRYSYEAFGKVVVDGVDVARYKYQGKQQFGNLYYFGARFYDPDTARFLTLDDYPTSVYQVSPATLNMYTFSRNDPINFVDLNGNAPWWHWFVDAALVVAGVASLLLAGITGPAAPIFTILGSTLLTAGVTGFLYDINNGDATNNDFNWGFQIIIGGVIGFVGGVAGAGAGAILASSIAQIPLLTIANTGAIFQQLIVNASEKSHTDDLKTTAWKETANNSTSVSGGLESPSLRKISKAGNTVGKLTDANKTALGPKLGRSISKNLQYPLKHSETALKIRARPSSSFASTLSNRTKAVPAAASDLGPSLSHSDLSSAQRYLHTQDISDI